MSQSLRREAMLEILPILTGLTKEEVEQKKPLRELLDRADKIKVKTRCYHFGILSFYYPRRTKDGSFHPFLGVSANLERVEANEWGSIIFPTYEPISADFDVELNLDEKFAERFIERVAKQRVKKEEKRIRAEKREAAKGTRRRGEKSSFAIAATGATIEPVAAAAVATV